MRRPFFIVIAIAIPGFTFPVAGQTSQPATQPAAPAATQADDEPDTQPAQKANSDQDGPGMYRVSAGPGGKYSTTLRAQSREDAIAKGIATVAQKAMDADENVEIHDFKVEKVGP